MEETGTPATDMTDVDMATVAEEEFCEKFAAQGTSTGKMSGKKKVVCWLQIFFHENSV